MAFTIPGLGSGIDVESMVNNLLSTKMEKYTKYKKEQIQNTYKEDVFKDLRVSIEKLQKTTKKLANPNELLSKKATSSSSAVGVTSTKENAVNGIYTIDVNQMATASSVALKPITSITDTKQVINATGASQDFTYTVNGVDKTIQVADGATIDDLVNSINKASNNLGVRASLIKDGNEYVFRMQSTDTGTANAISISNSTTLTGFEDTAAWDIQAGQDAQYKVDGYPSGAGNWITSSSNTLTDAIDGVTINLQGPGSATITVDASSDKMMEKIEEFVTDLNDVLGMINDINKPKDPNKKPTLGSEEEKKPSLGDGYKIGDHTSLFYNNDYVSRIRRNLEKIVTSRLPGFSLYDATAKTGDIYSSLGNLGITFDSKSTNDTYGKLVLDKEKLQKAIDDDPLAVANLIGAENIGSTTSKDDSFYFSNSIKNVTKPGEYEVSYEVDAGGNVINATIGGVPASFNAKTNTLTVTDGDPKGAALLLNDFTPGKTVTGTLNIRQGAATSITNSISDMFLTNGDLTKLSEGITKEINATNKTIEAEEKRLTEYRDRLMSRFTAMDLRISQMNSQMNLLGSYIGMNMG